MKRSARNPKLLAVVSLATFGLTAAITSCLAINQARTNLHLPEATLPTLQSSERGVQFYDRNNHYLCTVRADRDRVPVPLDKVAPTMRKALLSAEDRHFFQHHGIDFIAMGRAYRANWRAGHVVEGASTITQQLVRNLYLDKNDRSYKRKIKEAILSWETETRYSKPKILETYLNEIYFGGGVYGIERAANHYFSKHAKQLTVPESAFLAGIIKSPSFYADPLNRKAAISRQHEVLEKMAAYGYITSNQCQSYKAQTLAFKEGSSPVKYPYYITYATEIAHQKLGDDLWRQNVKVYTNLDPAAQAKAVSVLNNGFKHVPRGIDQGALVTESLKDGAVLAMVGGVGQYRDNQWNRAVNPHTAGSAFKPFVYLTGLIKGVLQPDSLINDSDLALDNPTAKDVYAPKNFDGKFKGWVTVRDALADSRNVCAVRIANQVGADEIVQTAREAGITSELKPFPSLALGACAVTPLELATAYGTLARSGAYMPAQFIRSITTEDGKVQTFAAAPSTNLPAENVNQVVDLMQDVVNRGTGSQAHLAGIAVAGKTGTADKGRDLWFVGFTPDTVTAVWGGSDKNLPVRGNKVTGGAVMARIWKEYMTAFYTQHTASRVAFAKPENPLSKTMPKYSDAILLTADPTQPPAPSSADNFEPAVDPRQVAENIPIVLYNARNATVGGIASAFFVEGMAAAQRWQLKTSQVSALSQTGLSMQDQACAQQRQDQTSAVNSARNSNIANTIAALQNPAQTQQTGSVSDQNNAPSDGQGTGFIEFKGMRRITQSASVSSM